MKNFINESTGEEIIISNYSILSRGGKIVYVDKITREEIKDKQGNRFIPIDKKGSPSFLKSNDKEKRVEMLKKRSRDHYKKEIKDKKYQMNKEAIKKFENG